MFVCPISVFCQPLNDDPCNAEEIEVKTICDYSVYSNIGATATSGIANPGCANYVDQDVWFSLTVPSNGVLSINSSAGSISDGGMALYSGTCSSLTLIECDDDDSEESGMPKLVFDNLTPGEVLFLRFWSMGGGEGDFSICLATPPDCGSSPPAGNTCETATPICDLNGYCGNTSDSYTSNSWSHGGFLGIGGDGLTEEFCGTIENNSFLTFVASENSISFDVWITSSTDGAGIQIFIFQSDDFCDGTVTGFGPCYNPGTVEPGAVTITANGLTIGETYYIMIDGQAGDVCEYIIGANSGFNLPVSVDPTSSNICLGDNVVLTAEGGDGTFNWDANPDLSSLTGSTVTVTPSAIGQFDYVVHSNTGNVLCPSSESAVATITVEDCSNCSVLASNSGPVCASSPFMDLTASFISGASYSWTGPNGFTSTDQNPINVALPTTPGLYNFSVTVDSLGTICQATTIVEVLPNPNVDAGNYVSICDTVASFALSNGSPIGGIYTGMGVGSNAFDPSAGDQLVYYEFIDINGCSSIDSVQLNVVECAPNDCIVNASNSGPICSSATSFSLFASNVGNATYTWSGPNSWSSNEQNPLVSSIPNSPGVYEYTVTADSAGTVCSSTTSIEVYALPNVNAGNYNPLCNYDNEIVLSGSPIGGNFSGTGVNGNHFTPNAGTQMIQYEYIDVHGCLNIDSTLIIVNQAPEINITAQNLNGCAPLIVEFNSLGNSGDCSWDFGNGNVSSECGVQSQVYNYSGCYDVSLVVTENGCSADTVMQQLVCVSEDAHADFTIQNLENGLNATSFIFYNHSSNADNYLWDFGNDMYSTLENPSMQYEEGAQNYEVCLIASNSNNCNDTVCQNVEVTEELVYFIPNSFTPDDDAFNQGFKPIFTSGFDPYDFHLTIFNRWGEVIWESFDHRAEWYGDYKGKNVPDGTYVWKVEFKLANKDDRIQEMGHVNVLR